MAPIELGESRAERSIDVDANGIDNGTPKKITNGTVNVAVNGASGAEVHDDLSSPNLQLEFDTIADTIEAFRSGNFIIVLDAPTRENEGDLILSAEDMTPEKMAFMVKHTSGLICSPLASSLTKTLSLPLMVPPIDNTEVDGTAYTVSVDAVHPSMTTGISAHDRALTCNMLASKGAVPESFRRPGHLFPLRAREGGARERRGHTEATVEFCRLAGKAPAGVLCELVEPGLEAKHGGTEVLDAEMRRGESCLRFGREWGIRVCTIEALVEYLEWTEGGHTGRAGAEKTVNGFS